MGSGRWAIGSCACAYNILDVTMDEEDASDHLAAYFFFGFEGGVIAIYERTMDSERAILQ